MHSPARLVTGTAAAALTAAALGLAIPSAHADSLGRPGFSAAAGCGAEDTAGTEAAAPCDDGGAAAGGPGRSGSVAGNLVAGNPGAESLGADDAGTDAPGADDPGPADGPDLTGELDTADDPAAVSGSSWPDADAEAEAEGEGDTGIGDGSGAGTLQQPGTGTGTAPGTKPGDRPETAPSRGTGPGTAPGTDPGAAKPPVSPGHKPTTAPSPSPSRPSGHVGTGVGGSAAPDTAQLAAGAGLVGAASISGLLLIRRRRADGPRH
uniref:Gram-positive cocci surface proteins LPxTG domain-containing protein n=1 Tax=Streptomyces sp. NBC_01401 TaxID=2903854 RepID=A0AAU3GYH8_9ACTN